MGKKKVNIWMIILAVIGAAAAVAAVIFAIIKVCCPEYEDFLFDDEFDELEGECDENGCYYASDDDFEK